MNEQEQIPTDIKDQRRVAMRRLLHDIGVVSGGVKYLSTSDKSKTKMLTQHCRTLVQLHKLLEQYTREDKP